jgi:hypothetical protein
MELHDMVLVVHVVAGTAALLLGGVLLWLSRTEPVLDRRSAVYHGAVLVVAVSAAGLVALDWPELWWLAPLAAFAYALALLGYTAPRKRFRGWEAAYAHGQGGSYIALVTAFIVVALTVDGRVDGAAAALPWALPTAVGLVVIDRWHRRLVAASRRHALPSRPRSRDQ